MTTTTTTLAEQIAGSFEEFCTLLAGAYRERIASALAAAEGGDFTQIHELDAEMDGLTRPVIAVAERITGGKLAMSAEDGLGEFILEVAGVITVAQRAMDDEQYESVIEARILAKYPEVAEMMTEFPELPAS